MSPHLRLDKSEDEYDFYFFINFPYCGIFQVNLMVAAVEKYLFVNCAHLILIFF